MGLIPIKFKLDFGNTRQKYLDRVFVTNDTSAYLLQMELVNNDGSPFLLDKVGVIKINFKKQDKSIVSGEAKIIDPKKGIIEYEMGTQEIVLRGNCIAEVQLYSQTGARLTSTQFIYTVRDELDDGTGIQSTTEYPVLTSLISDVATYKDRITSLEDVRIHEGTTAPTDTRFWLRPNN